MIFVCYGDTYIKIDLNKHIKDFNKSNADAIVSSSYYQLKFGTLSLNNKTKEVKKFNEKPIIREPINLGYFIFKKKNFINVKKKQQLDKIFK